MSEVPRKKKKPDRLDFLYDEHAIREENQEAYLLGKRFQFKQTEDDLHKLENKDLAGSSFLSDRSKLSSFIDRQNKVYSDPMLAVQRAQISARRKILMNKYTMKKMK